MTTLTSIATLKTVQIDYTSAPIIRSVARRDIPEYGLTEGQVFYMARSSKNDGTYYLLTWDYTAIRWNCSCPATTNNCRHHRMVKADCAKAHSLQGYKPTAVSKADTFAQLFAKYDVRSQSVVQQAEQVAHNELIRQGAVLETLAQLQEDERVTRNYEATQEQARRATLQRETQLRTQAPLNGNRAFSFMR